MQEGRRREGRRDTETYLVGGKSTFLFEQREMKWKKSDSGAEVGCVLVQFCSATYWLDCLLSLIQSTLQRLFPFLPSPLAYSKNISSLQTLGNYKNLQISLLPVNLASQSFLEKSENEWSKAQPFFFPLHHSTKLPPLRPSVHGGCLDWNLCCFIQ